MADGSVITAKAVASNLNGRVTYLKMVGPDNLPNWAFKAVASYKNSMPCPMIYVGLDTKPNLNAHHTIFTGTVEFMNEVWDKYYTKGLIPENAMSLICWPTETDSPWLPKGTTSSAGSATPPPPIHRWARTGTSSRTGTARRPLMNWSAMLCRMHATTSPSCWSPPRSTSSAVCFIRKAASTASSAT